MDFTYTWTCTDPVRGLSCLARPVNDGFHHTSNSFVLRWMRLWTPWHKQQCQVLRYQHPQYVPKYVESHHLGI